MMEDDEDSERHEKPLGGMVICFTSVLPEERTKLVAIAEEMGAMHKLDLTSDVTHLLIGSVDTPKYKYVARERDDIKVLKPEWIYAVRDAWVQGGETNVSELEQTFKFPTFSGRIVCITGFEDIEFRKSIDVTVTQNGGEYSGDLTKSVTHLIARVPEGAKYKFARVWGLNIVSIEWLNQSLERGMVLEESLYSLDLPEEERGKGAWNRRNDKSKPLNSLGKRQRDAVDSASARPSSGRKLRKSASSKFLSIHRDMWQNILEVAAAGRTETKPRDAWAEEAAPASEASAMTGFQLNPQATVATRLETTIINGREESPGGMLQHMEFHIFGFSSVQSDILRRSLEPYDAAITLFDKSAIASRVKNKDITQEFLMVPHQMPLSQISQAQKEAGIDLSLVTEMWLECCIFNNRFVNPEEYPPSRPFFTHKIQELDGFSISSTGFRDICLLHISKIINIIGSRYSEQLDPKVGALIRSCDDKPKGSRSEKLKYAYIWDIPVITETWLWDSIRCGTKMPFDNYLVPMPSSTAAGNSRNTSAAKLGAPENEDQSTKRRSRHLHRAEPIKPVTVCGPFIELDRSEGHGSDKSVKSLPKDTAIHPDSAVNQDAAVNQDDAVNQDAAINPDAACLETTTLASPQKSNQGVPPSTAESEDQRMAAISSAITAILSESRRAASVPVAPRPQHRKLIGRATSNLSTISNGSAHNYGGASGSRSFSRTSSVGSMNTDGLGSAFGDLADFDETNADNGKDGTGKEQEEDFPSTQLWYEDPEAEKMRAEMLARMGRSPEGDHEKFGPGRQRVGVRGVVQNYGFHNRHVSTRRWQRKG